jgi:hypothetical protein
MKNPTRTAILCAFLSAAALPAAANHRDVAKFSLPGLTNTHPTAINESGVLAGNYSARDNSTGGGFVRAADGTITTFLDGDAVGASINDAGVIAGNYAPIAGGPSSGFIRTPDGTITPFEGPHGDAIISAYINSDGIVAGSASPGSGAALIGYVGTPNGKLRTFQTSDQFGTVVLGINKKGWVISLYFDDMAATHSFLRSPHGKITPIEAPDAGSGFLQGTAVAGINDSHEVVGSYTASDGLVHSFMRSAKGVYTEFDPRNSESSSASAINNAGVITGHDSIGVFVRNADGAHYTHFEIPGNASIPMPTAINESVQITGTYSPDGEIQDQAGFLYTPSGSEGPLLH